MEMACTEEDHKDHTKTNQLGTKISYIEKENYLDDQFYCIHFMLKSAWGNNFGAPVKDLLSSVNSDAKVLDYGCGSGFWTLEMATEFPLAKFYGVDLENFFPDSVSPDNVEFLVANIIGDGLPFKDGEFDYIFCRNLIFCFPTPSLKSIVIKELLRVLKPGGYIELIEGDNQGYDSSDNLKFWNTKGLRPWLMSVGIDFEFGVQFKEYLTSIDQLKDVTEEKIRIPCGKCDSIEGKEYIGELCAEISRIFMRSIGEKLRPFLNLTQEEYDDLIKKIESDIKDENNKCYSWYRRFIAKKKS